MLYTFHVLRKWRNILFYSPRQARDSRLLKNKSFTGARCSFAWDWLGFRFSSLLWASQFSTCAKPNRMLFFEEIFLSCVTFRDNALGMSWIITISLIKLWEAKVKQKLVERTLNSRLKSDVTSFSSKLPSEVTRVDSVRIVLKRQI